MDEILGLLLATKNKPNWFTTKEYVDSLIAGNNLEQILSATFRIEDGYLIVEVEEGDEPG